MSNKLEILGFIRDSAITIALTSVILSFIWLTLS
jgi:hypothetical protein